MSEPDPQMPPPATDPRDEALLALFHDHYRPPQRDALQRAAFARQVMQRAPETRRWGWPSLATAGAVACLALWLAYGRAPVPAAPGANGATLLALVVEDEAAPSNDAEFLPDDYALLATDLDQ
jgi:hypothetical protein